MFFNIEKKTGTIERYRKVKKNLLNVKGKTV